MTLQPSIEPTGTRAGRSVPRAASRWDLVAGALSILCAVHCAAGPLLIAVAPVLASGRVESVLSASLVSLSALVVVRGAARHQRWHTLLPLGVGLLALAALRAQGRCCAAEPLPPQHLGLVVTSCVGFVSAHALNARALRRCCATCPT